MSLQDDIARYANRYRTTSAGLTDAIAAGLERDYLAERKDKLQPVGILNGHYSIAGVRVAPVERDLGLLKVDRDYAVAVYEFAKSLESEAAALQARRDGLVKRYSPSQLGYDDIHYMERRIVDHALEAEDRAAAAEAEVERLRGERS